MRTTRLRPVVILILGALVGACGSSASPSPDAIASGLPSEASASVAATAHSSTPSAATTAPTVATTTPAPIPSGASADLPIRGSARELSAANVGLAPAPAGGVYVSIPVRKGPAVLVLFDKAGRLRPGWPISIKGTTGCGTAMPVSDGTVRIICGSDAFAFDAQGRLMDGWPVHLSEETTTGLVGGELVNVNERYVTNEESGDQISHDAVVTAIAADGTARSSPPLGLFDRCCDHNWAIGPDGIAYGVGRPAEGVNRTSVTALEASGVVSEWNVDVAGIGSRPSFGPDGKLILAFGSDTRRSTRVAVLTRPKGALKSAAVSLRSVEGNPNGSTGDCTGSVAMPASPLVSSDGTIFPYSDLDNVIYRLDRSLAVAAGWPFVSDGRSTPAPGRESEHEAGYCPTPLPPVVGPDGTLVVALEAADSKVGGSLVAVGANGRIRPGWPVGLKRPGSEFWAVAVGSSRTTYTLAVEPESGGKSSGTILAIAPDSTILWSTTIVEP